MKVVLSIILTVLTIQVSFGQVAIIQDPDGWTNVRAEPNASSEIILRVNENEVFWYNIEESEQEWVSIYIPKDKYSLGTTSQNYVTGYIHTSRLLPLENLSEYNRSDFTFEYVIGEFDSTDRVIDKIDGKWVTSIDGRTPWGIDGNTPNSQVNDILVYMDQTPVQIHEVFYTDLYQCNPHVTIYKENETYFVHHWNSDGAGAYEIVWVINKAGLLQRLVGSMY